MKFYFAASLAEAELAKEISETIEKRTNWKCTSSWFMPSKRNGVETAIECLEEVDDANVLVLYASKKTRGKWLECGYALAKNKPIVFYIEKSNISHPTFAYMPQFTWVYSIDELIEQMLKDKEMLSRLKELKKTTCDEFMPPDQAFKDAETFIEYLKDIDIIEPRITIAGDKEINFCWHDIGIYIDLGFYGDGTYSYFAKNRSGRKYYGDNLRVERGIQRRILNIIKR